MAWELGIQWEERVGVTRGRGVEVELGSCSRGLLSFSTTGVIRATGGTKSRISKPIPLPARGRVMAVLETMRGCGSSERRFRVEARGELVSVTGPAPGAISSLVELSLPTNISVRVGLW